MNELSERDRVLVVAVTLRGGGAERQIVHLLNCAEITGRCRKVAATHFSAQGRAERYAQLYQEVLA